LFNNLGQLVAKWSNLSSENGHYELPVYGINQGLYTIVFVGPKNVYNDKVIIQ